MDEEPFRPRLRPRAFVRLLKPREGPPGGIDLLAWAAFAFTLVALWRLFAILRGQDPSGGSAAALGAGGQATTWLILSVGSCGILAYALHRRRDPGVHLKRGFWRRPPR